MYGAPAGKDYWQWLVYHDIRRCKKFLSRRLEVRKMYRLYTDGACKGQSRRGGWAYLLKEDEVPGAYMEHSGHVADTTNNRMELQAVIEGLKRVEDGASIEIVTDSTYVIVTSKSTNPNLLNLDLVMAMRQELRRVDYTFTHVKGHSGHPENERVDKLASAAAFRADWIPQKVGAATAAV